MGNGGNHATNRIGACGDGRGAGYGKRGGLGGHHGWHRWSNNLRGTNGDDNLLGKGGNDALFKLGGRDNLLGNSGNDLVDGGPGADNITGGDGTDLLADGENRGGARDTLSGGDGNDFLNSLNSPAARDVVVCGDGFERVLADRKDQIAPDCEKVFLGLSSVDAFVSSIPESFFEGLPLF